MSLGLYDGIDYIMGKSSKGMGKGKGKSGKGKSGKSRKANSFDIVVTSAANNGNGAALRFDGSTGQFIGNYTSGIDLNDPRDIEVDVFDPSTVLINGGDDNVLRFDGKTGEYIETFIQRPNLNAGGSVFGPDQNYYAGSRSLVAILRFDGETGDFIDEFIDSTTINFPRGFVFGSDGNFYWGNGADPASGSGGGGILQYDGVTGALLNDAFIVDPELSVLDAIDGPDGNIWTTSEFPFRDPNGKGTVRIYNIDDGALLKVLDPGLDADGEPILAAPRGMRFGPDNNLYVSSTGTESVVRFDGETLEFIDTFIKFPNLNGQALNFVPSI